MNSYPSRLLNVLVMHPDAIVCAGLVTALRQRSSFQVFVHGGENPLPEGTPIDVAIGDYNNAMLLARPPARDMFALLGPSRILVLTANDREADIRRAIQSGIHGYVLLGGSLDELADGVTAVGSGMRYLSPTVAQRMADSLAGITLTLRESEVLRLVATGQSNKAIARQLSIELGTVKSHVSSIMSKLGAMSRTQAASIAATRGLLSENERNQMPHQPTTFSPRARTIDARAFA